MVEILEKPEEVVQVKKTLEINRILDILPHRYPFVLIDRVTDYELGNYIEGYKNVSINEPFFQGHFPGMPIMPGVLMVEAMAQLGCLLVSQMPEGEGKLFFFAGLNGLRFRRPVVPGDRMDMRVELLRLRASAGKAYGRGTVDGELVADGEMLFSFLPDTREERK